MKRSLEDRFWEKVNKTDGCWEWKAFKDRQGYGHFRGISGRVLAHRQSYELIKGNIPKGLNVCHACGNSSCVRPEHLFAGTQKENMQDFIFRRKMGKSLFPIKKSWWKNLIEWITNE